MKKFMPVDSRTASQVGYDTARLLVLAAPFNTAHEAAALQRASERLQAYLGMCPEEAILVARRCLLFQRDRRLHETLMLEARPDSLSDIADAISIEGIDQLATTHKGRLIVAFHYGPYSSLLWLALIRAAAAGSLPPLTCLLNHTLDPHVWMSDERWDELEEHDVVSSEVITRFWWDRRGRGAARDLADILRRGGSVLVFPDAWFVAPDDRRAIRCRIGTREIGVPRGVDWLARQSDCEVIAAMIMPDGNGHRITLNSTPDVAVALRVIGDVVTAEPAPWEGWTRDQQHL